MIKATQFKNAKLRYKDEGNGQAIVLLHGYLESLEIWEGFADELALDFRVICIDIPGHGESGIVAAYHTMDDMAEAVVEVLDELNISKCFMAGHSLGGYVTMAFAGNHSDRLAGYCLFHSTPFADPEEKKQNRDREIELVREGKKDLLINTNIPKMFADENLEKLSMKVDRAKGIGRRTPDEGIIVILNGMKARPDRSVTLQKAQVPVLWIIGKKDNYIPFEVIKEKQSLLNEKGKTLVLENSGHIGFIEERDLTLKEISAFAKDCAYE
ncbi:MAG: alpha/beta fold hydrolase [Bacteroidetes bacterium]|jgi:pimeloyl-ACP methyl ester carboxylesterase|nr:alpha/beta fold hydrolase [Bacteroidota bacterium]